MAVGLGVFYFLTIPEQCYIRDDDDFCKEELLSLLTGSVNNGLTQLVKIAIGVFQVLLLTYTPETYPTQVRSIGFGFCMSVGKVKFMDYPDWKRGSSSVL